MYMNLNAPSLGISGRQNELIELTLTYKFQGFDIDIDTLVKQVEARGQDHATRFIASADIKIGSFELPLNLAASEEDFQRDLGQLEKLAAVAASIGAETCVVDLCPYNEGRPYHENFELHRSRISQVAKVLAAHKIRLGLGFLAPLHHRAQYGSTFIATPDTLLTLIRTVPEENVGLCLDAWHWHVAGGTMAQLSEFPIERIFMVRVADLPTDANLETVTEEERMLPGATGTVPIADWIRWLSEQGYAGPITPFCHPAQFLGGTRTQSVEQAAAALKELLDQNLVPDPEAEGSETEATASR